MRSPWSLLSPKNCFLGHRLQNVYLVTTAKICPDDGRDVFLYYAWKVII